MNAKNWFLTGMEAIIWYGFIYYALYSIKNPVNLFNSALILLVLVYVGTISCPWFRQTEAFRKMINE